nr:MAG TPA: hypothetical protein [Caudoviricetes sp.]
MCHDSKFRLFFRIVTQNKRHGQYRKSRSKACSGKGGAGAQIAWAVPEERNQGLRWKRGGHSGEEGMRKAGSTRRRETKHATLGTGS